MKDTIRRSALLIITVSLCSFIFIAESKAEVKIGYGWSVNPDEAQADSILTAGLCSNPVQSANVGPVCP